MRVLLVEDNPQVTAYVRSLLAQHLDIQVLGEAAGIEDGYSLLCNTPADLWILDISLQDGNVFQLLEMLEQSAVPQAGIIFLTAYGTTDLSSRPCARPPSIFCSSLSIPFN
ncbi:MAG: LytR/AlgR family response regulator transcription factor [Saprospiraceae bacterium]